MPRKNSSTRAVNDTVTAARLQDINEDIDDLYSSWTDHLRVSQAISWTALRIDISAGAYYIWSSQGVYAWWTDIVVTNSATNYVMIDNSWTITISTSARTAWLWRLAQVVCSGGAVTSIVLRNNMVFGGAALDITALTEDTSPDGANDFFITYDASAWTNKKVKLNNVVPIPFYISATAGESLTVWQPVRYWYTYAGQSITFWTDNNNDSIWYDSASSYAKWWSFYVTVWWKLTAINMWLKKVGSPTFNLNMRLYNSTWSVLIATSSTTVAASWLTTWYVSTAFAFDNIILWPLETYIFMCVPSVVWWTSNYVQTWQANTDWYYWNGTGYRMDSGGVFTEQSLDRWTWSVTIGAAWESASKLYRTRWLTYRESLCVWFCWLTVATDATTKLHMLVNNDQSWLTPGEIYYIADSYWTISTTAWKYSKAIWRAISTTWISVDHI